jgi:hypothetical protein
MFTDTKGEVRIDEPSFSWTACRTWHRDHYVAVVFDYTFHGMKGFLVEFYRVVSYNTKFPLAWVSDDDLARCPELVREVHRWLAHNKCYRNE